jgi:hypothetical protein
MPANLPGDILSAVIADEYFKLPPVTHKRPTFSAIYSG